MSKKKSILLMIAAVFAAAALGAGGFMLGRERAASEHRAEKQIDIELARSELDGLGEISGTIYVTGHKSPDTDTVGSSIAFAALLRQLGYDAVPVVLGKINNETKLVLESGGIETPQLLENAAERNMVLVDHSEYAQSADGLEDAHIIAVIDHHGDGSVTTGNQLIYDARPLGATATIIWLRYRSYGLEPDKQTAYAMVGSILSDTKGLKSDATTFADREALKALSHTAGIDDTEALYDKMYKASISYDGMTDEEIFLSDYKEYECSGKKYSIGCVNAYDAESAQDLAERMAKVMSADSADSGLDMSFAEIKVRRDDLALTYIVPSNEAAKETMLAAFGDAAYDGAMFKFSEALSRKEDVVPAITKVLGG